MENYSDYSDYREVYSEIDLFLKDHHLDNIEISLKDSDFQHICLKLPSGTPIDTEGLLDYIEDKNESKFYIISTLDIYGDTPTLKKYYIPYKRLNEFLYCINDPDFDEQVISIDQAVE